MRKRVKGKPYIPKRNLPVPPSATRNIRENKGKNRIRKRHVKIISIIFLIILIPLLGYLVLSYALPLFSISIPIPNLLQKQFIIEPVSDKKKPIEELKEYLNQASIEYTTLDISSDNSSIVMKDSTGLTVIFSSLKDLKSQVSSLQAIKRQLTIDNSMNGNKERKLEKIDFRFTKTIVNFE